MTASVTPYIGLTTAPVAWAASTQLGQITPYVDCRHGISWSAIACAGLLAASVAGTLLGRAGSQGFTGTRRFAADLAFLVALASIFALVLQGAATMLLDACQR